MSRQLLILDLDETLVYGTEQPLTDLAPDFRVGPFVVYRRPFLEEFLATAREWFDLAVWSSASSSYVNSVVANVVADAGALRFVWSCDRCTRRFDPERLEYFYAKNLTKVCKLGYSLERLLIVDDSPEKVARNYGNHVRVHPFTGDPSDTELRDLLPFLERIRTVENVRAFEKRNWRAYRAAEPLRE